jgi:hypothetical protein
MRSAVDQDAIRTRSDLDQESDFWLLVSSAIGQVAGMCPLLSADSFRARKKQISRDREISREDGVCLTAMAFKTQLGTFGNHLEIVWESCGNIWEEMGTVGKWLENNWRQHW